MYTPDLSPVRHKKVLPINYFSHLDSDSILGKACSVVIQEFQICISLVVHSRGYYIVCCQWLFLFILFIIITCFWLYPKLWFTFSTPQCNSTSPVNLLSVFFSLVDLRLIYQGNANNHSTIPPYIIRSHIITTHLSPYTRKGSWKPLSFTIHEGKLHESLYLSPHIKEVSFMKASTFHHTWR